MLVALECTEDGERGVAVGLEEALREPHPLRTTVAFHLALVGAELDLPDQAALEERSGGLVQGRDRFAEQPLRSTVQADAQVPVWVAVAEEEPAVGRAGLAGALEDRPHQGAEHLVGAGRSAVELGVQPRRTGREGSLSQRKVLGVDRCGGRRTLVGGHDERHHDLVGEAALRPAHAQLVRPRIDLGDFRALPPLREVSQDLHAQHVVEVDRQEVVPFDERDVAGEPEADAQGLHRAEQPRAAPFAERPELPGVQLPAGGREHSPTRDHARQIARMGEQFERGLAFDAHGCEPRARRKSSVRRVPLMSPPGPGDAATVRGVRGVAVEKRSSAVMR